MYCNKQWPSSTNQSCHVSNRLFSSEEKFKECDLRMSLCSIETSFENKRLEFLFKKCMCPSWFQSRLQWARWSLNKFHKYWQSTVLKVFYLQCLEKMEWHEFQAFLHELSIRSSYAALKKDSISGKDWGKTHKFGSILRLCEVTS